MSRDKDEKWQNDREKITYEEGRHVLKAQKSDIDDIDDKALRTVRIAALLLGVGATGIRVIGTDNVNESIAGLALASFLLSLVFGIFVYNESDEVVGPSASYLDRLRRDEMTAPWTADLLVQFRDWIDENQEIVEFNGYLLMTSQFFFVLGLALGTAALLALEIGEMLLLAGGLALIVVVTLVVITMRVRRS
jgi:hypothetical protein